jgi:hypothetical protein
MTRARKLAIAISNWVCRNAPAGAKDWGAASARELEHIASDWEALRWAVGSMSVLWWGRNVSAPPITSVEQVPILARCLARVVWRRTVLCAAIVVFQAYWCTYYLANMHGLVRLGSILVVVAGGLIAVQAYLRRWRGMPVHADNAAMVAPLRAELVRQRQFHSGGWLAARLYALMPGMLLLCCGLWANDQTAANAWAALGAGACFAALATIGTKIQLRTAEGFQRRIDSLDALHDCEEASKA